MSDAPLNRCLSVRQLARRWGVSPRKVRSMIRAGRLVAFNVGLAGRVQLRIAPSAIAQAEAALAVAPAVKRRKRQAVDPEVAALLESGA